MRKIFFLLVLALIARIAYGGDGSSDLKNADTNHDGYLDRAELTQYFLEHDDKIIELRKYGLTEDKLRRLASDAADDALSSTKDVNADKISLEDGIFYIERKKILTAKDQKMKIGWPGLGFSRSLTDDVDPRKFEIDDRPLIFSYSHDRNRQDNENQLTLLGSITFYQYDKDWPGGSYQIKPGVEIDADTSKDVPSSTVDFGVNFARYWFSDSSAVFNSQVLTIMPKYSTDRRFERDVYEVGLSWSFSSIKILRAGYDTWFGGTQKSTSDSWVRLYWKPELGLESGAVADAAHSDKLEKIKSDGPYARFLAGGKITITPTILSPRTNLTFSYKNRYDLDEHWNKHYWTAELDYNLAKNVQFTFLYRRGEKPPAFTDINTFLVGIGITQ
jgi:hypothetical protein